MVRGRGKGSGSGYGLGLGARVKPLPPYPSLADTPYAYLPPPGMVASEGWYPAEGW